MPKIGSKDHQSPQRRKSKNEPATIPAKTASFESPRKSMVWKDWVVGATGIEPVTPSMSTRCSPAELRAPHGVVVTGGVRISAPKRAGKDAGRDLAPRVRPPASCSLR